jgi:hypothetical protein
VTQGPQSKVRLYCLLARKSPLAVVFRRGPTRQVQLLLWNRDTDEFYEGQWFKGRIYERRCDLSPSGERLIYFAANQKKPFFSWTAVSRPPYLTAVLLWPKGDAWGGGGLFSRENEIRLNHREGETTMPDGFRLPARVCVEPLGLRSGWGEDSPIEDTRLKREGWIKAAEGEQIRHGINRPIAWVMNPPLIWKKDNPKSGSKCELQMHIKGIGEKNGPWYVIDYVISRGESPGPVASLPATDWADWDHNGDLLFGKAGRLYRVSCSSNEAFDISKAKELIDLRGNKFKNVESPVEAKQWNGRLKEQRVR